jgi:hypothetical protein
MLLAPYALLAAHELGHLPTSPVIRDVGLYLGAWLLGFAHHDGMLRLVLLGFAPAGRAITWRAAVPRPPPPILHLSCPKAGKSTR